MMRKILRLRKLLFVAVIVCCSFSIIFLISVENISAGSPTSLPHQRRIQGLSKPKNILRSFDSVDINDLTPIIGNQIAKSSVYESIRRRKLDHRLTYAENFSLPILLLPDNNSERLAYGLNQDDEGYLRSLRKKGQIEPLPSGGERIRVTRYFPVRFPFALKNKRPYDWEPVYRIFLNLTFFPWWDKAELAECRNYSTSFAPPGALPTKALASFPASGNSWVRQLIESSSGIFTGSMYGDKSLMRNGMYGEGVIFDSGMTIVQKTHGYTTGQSMLLPSSKRITQNHMSELNNQGIIIIRNPFKALISHRHLDAAGHIFHAPKSHFVGEGWRDFVLLKIKLWKEFYIDWLENSRPQDICVVIFEELLADVLPVIKRMLKFLSLPVDDHRLECISKFSGFGLKRKELNTKIFISNPFTEDLKQEVFKAIDDLNEVLTKKYNISLPVNEYKLTSEKDL